MGLCFGIHILGYYPDFDPTWPVVMWDDNTGPVEVSWPIDSQNFTVYKNGTGVMKFASNTGFATRIVSFSTNLNFTTNSSFSDLRRESIGFQLRTPGIGGSESEFYNFAAGRIEQLTFGESKGSDAATYTKSRSVDAREVSIGTGTRYDIFQQTWSNKER
jgi:hypothetical protein